MGKIKSHIFYKNTYFSEVSYGIIFQEGGIIMIDTLFSVIEDIYFKVIDDSTPEPDQTNTKILYSDVSLSPLLEKLKQKAYNTPYIGKSGNQFKLLKVAGLFMNYILYGDDGVITLDEQNLINSFIKQKLNKLSIEEQNELKEIFNERIALHVIEEYKEEHSLPLRSICMIVETMIDQVKDEARYFLPLEALLSMLLN
jgi:hypothetical protein